MKKFLKGLGLLASFTVLLNLNGCKQIQDSANTLRNEGEKVINQASQQAENLKNQVIQTKMKIDEKSQQVVNAVDALNKLGQ